jgi:hypothetical protein
LFKIIFYIFAFALTSCVTQETKVKNIEHSGNLKQSNSLGCINADELKNTFTPVDLFQASTACAHKGLIVDSAKLFMLARIYGSFDIRRVSDQSAHQSIAVLVQKTYISMGNKANAVETEINDRLLKNPDQFQKLCDSAKNAGAPIYYPEYMINHGMSAMLGTNENNGIVIGFDSVQAWKETLSRCN